MSSEPIKKSEPPRTWVEELIESEESVRNVLDEIHEQHLLGNYETVRERLRAFAEAESGIFRVISFAALDVESFYDDLAEQYDDEPPQQTLKEIGQRYEPLRSELELVFAETFHGYHNPSPSMIRQLRYSESTNMPRLAFEVYSGDVELSRFDYPPSQALTLAGLIIEGVGELLEQATTNADKISARELERSSAVHEQIEADLQHVQDYLPKTDTSETDSALAEFDDDDRYGDWGVY